MAKEMMIVFVYDTLRCHAEAPEPADAVLYFHPGWVSESQRHALCGQLVGTVHCISSLLAPPTAVTLQSGKFLIEQYGRYILAIGSDRNIPDWVLKNRAELLASMIKVYHGDLDTIAAQFPGENNPRFAEKLYQMFETYLPILQFGCHIFQRVPLLQLPKSATSVYIESMQILEYCQRIKGVLGGTILYNNKVVASQLNPTLTSNLAVVDPYRIKSPAEVFQTDTPLPLGAQLLVIYLSKKEFEVLNKDAKRSQKFYSDPEVVINDFKKKLEAPKEFQSTGMKRDKSLLFTAVPEEDTNLISPPMAYAENIDNHIISNNKKHTMPDVIPFTTKPRTRPNKLALAFKNSVQATVDENSTLQSKESEKIFTGQTSVCSTPMVEFKRLHGNVLSICQNPETQTPADFNTFSINREPDVVNVHNQPQINSSILSRTQENNLNGVTSHISKPEIVKKSGSVSDIQETLKRISNRASAKFRSKKKGNTSDDLIDCQSPLANNVCVTITDPSFPVFRNDGLPISQDLYNKYMEEHYAKLNSEDTSNKDNMFTYNRKFVEQNKIEDFDSDMRESPKRTVKTIPEIVNVNATENKRKSLNLPLKPMNDTSDTSTDNTQKFEKRNSGVQLTPLMEKLSQLAYSEKSSGYSSRVITPLDRNISGFHDQTDKVERHKDTIEHESENLAKYGSHGVRSVLFVCGLQNMSLMVVLDAASANDADTIHTLWEISLNTLGPIETKCMEPLPTNTDSTEYSYLTLDPDWGTIKKGGPWSSLDIATMGLIHSEFDDDHTLSEVILRSEESVVLGTTCGGAEIYYQETGTKQPGLPTPSDIMVNVQIKAKRRLHRDHSVVIL